MKVENKPYSEACDQNRKPILDILKVHFKNNQHVLEVGSGTGQHAAYFPKYLPRLHWQPSDILQHIPGIEAWRIEADLPNVEKCIELDVNQPQWPEPIYNAVFSANTAHIMPWSAVTKFFTGVGELLSKYESIQTKIFCLYGPFNYQGAFTSESNARFDQWLKAQNPAQGIREIDEIIKLAKSSHLQLSHDIKMPVNNRILIFSSC